VDHFILLSMIVFFLFVTISFKGIVDVLHTTYAGEYTVGVDVVVTHSDTVLLNETFLQSINNKLDMRCIYLLFIFNFK